MEKPRLKTAGIEIRKGSETKLYIQEIFWLMDNTFTDQGDRDLLWWWLEMTVLQFHTPQTYIWHSDDLDLQMTLTPRITILVTRQFWVMLLLRGISVYPAKEFHLLNKEKIPERDHKILNKPERVANHITFYKIKGFRIRHVKHYLIASAWWPLLLLSPHSRTESTV